MPNEGQVGVGRRIYPPAVGSLWAGLQPGDVTYWGGSISDYYHSGIYAGNGYVWDVVGSERVGLQVLQNPPGYALRLPLRRCHPVCQRPLPAVATTSLPVGSLSGGSKGSYSATLHATGGRAPYWWSRAKGSLPPGLTRPPPA